MFAIKLYAILTVATNYLLSKTALFFHVAQLAEQVTVNHSVVGSSPTLEAKFIFSNLQPS